MTSGLLQGLITILFMSGFVLLVFTVYRPSKRKTMDEFALIPLEKDKPVLNQESEGADTPSVNHQ